MILVDTGPLVAAALSGDVNHVRCTELFTALHLNREALLVPALVVTEVCYLLEREVGPWVEAGFLESVAEGDFAVVDLEPADYARAGELVVQYADLPLGAVDASVIALAERLGITEVATLDRRHFTVVRPRGIGPLILLPE
ncbi:MAG TPA: PIN domain-containing protein [Kineosporiaceae bacterium]|nr:PIN domain-containing protein [Kineosporiaceae bacterium]